MWDISDMGEDQSVFISTRAKNQSPVTINIGCFLALVATCLSCPLKTYLRKKTKMLQVKVRKLYYYDPKKPMPVPTAFYPGSDTAPDILGQPGTEAVKVGGGDTKNMDFLPSRDKGNMLKTTHIEADRPVRRRENDRRGNWEEGYGERRGHDEYEEELQRGERGRRWDRDVWG